MAASASLAELAELLDDIENMKGVSIEDKSTTRTKKYILSAADRMEASSKIHEMLDKKRIRYVSAVKSGSSFPATSFVVNGNKIKGALFQYKPTKKPAADAKTTLMLYFFARNLDMFETCSI